MFETFFSCNIWVQVAPGTGIYGFEYLQIGKWEKNTISERNFLDLILEYCFYIYGSKFVRNVKNENSEETLHCHFSCRQGDGGLHRRLPGEYPSTSSLSGRQTRLQYYPLQSAIQITRDNLSVCGRGGGLVTVPSNITARSTGVGPRGIFCLWHFLDCRG